jgi:hypothetical protein
MWRTEIPEGAVALGYKRLVDIFSIKTIPHFRWSFASPKWEKREFRFDDQKLTIYLYPSSYRLTDDVFEHLEFALKHEGVNLFILKQVLSKISPLEMTSFVESKPMGKYARMLWYLYEKFQEVILPLPDLKQGGYVSLLDDKYYYTGKPNRSPRHRISCNLLGSLEFAPLVRRTSLLKRYEGKLLNQAAHDLAKEYNPLLVARAMRYLFTKETISSWEIEREKPDNDKLAKFVGLLHRAGSIGALSEQAFVELQKIVIDSRFALDSYRDFQNYVGEEPGLGKLILHYITPRSQDVRSLMQNLISSFEIMEKSAIDPVITAAILSFGFVFIHPFEDGNGRIHRFLIHYALSHLGFTPAGLIFPISAAIMRDIKQYDGTLEIFSRPLMDLITDYRINDVGEMIVFQDTKDFYRFIDFTPIVEYLYECIDKTMIRDFREELAFLADYDNVKRLCKEVVDMPNQKIDLLIKCVRQNSGRLSAKKRENYFQMLTDEEIIKMERIINS